ncbi:MAG: endonuclease III domain-containing protein [Methanotrichaceae archaeon]
MMIDDEIVACLKTCIGLLEKTYGVPRRAKKVDPVDVLVRTILSQNTTSANTHRAFIQLKRSYPDYEEILGTPDVEIAEQIRRGGLANIKARRIKEALEKIKGDAQSIDLNFLEKMTPEDARRYLLALPGVGPKTAAVVLLFAFGMPLMPVDTHVNRVSRRLGFVPQKASIGEAQSLLEEVVPPDKYCSFHVNLIRHGRKICKARLPLCDVCILKEICEYRSSQATKVK